MLPSEERKRSKDRLKLASVSMLATLGVLKPKKKLPAKLRLKANILDFVNSVYPCRTADSRSDVENFPLFDVDGCHCHDLRVENVAIDSQLFLREFLSMADEILLLYRDKERKTTPLFQVNIQGLRFVIAPRILNKKYVEREELSVGEAES